MNTNRLIVCICIILSLVGCGKRDTYADKHQSLYGSSVQNLGDYRILAYVANGNKVITLYRPAGFVCVENADGSGHPATGRLAAHSCWAIEAAPPEIKALY